MYELRLDYLDKKTFTNTKEIIDIINIVKTKFCDKKIIATIRTIKDGGKAEITDYIYFDLISKMLKESKADYIDIEYSLYSKKKEAYNKLIAKSTKTIIISKHLFNKKTSFVNYKTALRKMTKCKGDILKLAVMPKCTIDVYNFMKLAREYTFKDKKNRKGYIFIAMGKYGLVSRIFPEYTNTGIVFINAYKGKGTLGQVNMKKYFYYRRRLKSRLINK